MKRKRYEFNHLHFSYLDSGGDGEIIIALHAHWLEASTFKDLATELLPEWRVIALDQRGHGYTDHAKSYNRDDYLKDILGLFEHLQIEKAVLLGNSLGGVNAYQFAARHPEKVRALIIEDIGVDFQTDVEFIKDWEGNFKTREELESAIGPRFLPSLKDSIRKDESGWHLAFEIKDMLQSQKALNGNHWKDWLASSCPALVLHGRDSRVSDRTQLEEMAQRRPNTEFKELSGGHALHLDNPDGFLAAIENFLNRRVNMNNSIENEILDLERKFWTALRDRDVETMKELTDDTCILTGAQGVSKFNREDFEMMMEQTRYKILDFDINDPQISVLGDDVAVVGYKVNEKLSVEGKPVTLRAVDASTWIKKGGKWVCSMHTEALSGDPFGRDKSSLSS